ncbi:MAG TPA: response regulator transcription factor [Bacteroidetes bacterium]|nr:response regulator transcription factor [Bacteroidota bacterium]
MDKRRILLVEDDENLGYLLQDSLEMNGYCVTLCRNGEEGGVTFREAQFDLVILDVMMPRKNGFELAAEIRMLDVEVAMVFLTAKGLKEDRIQGLKIGADDYITKPFSIEEFLLRIQAILRRLQKPMAATIKQFHFADYRLDIANLSLYQGEIQHQLTEREAQLLHFLATQPNRLLRRDDILKAVWGDDGYFTGRSMDVFISRLRKFFREDPKVNIVNIHGAGYRFEIGE